MTRPDDPFEAASYDLNQFRERRMAERRMIQRDMPDRRQAPYAGQPLPRQPQTDADAPDTTD
jgi:hypothetical protein